MKKLQTLLTLLMFLVWGTFATNLLEDKEIWRHLLLILTGIIILKIVFKEKDEETY